MAGEGSTAAPTNCNPGRLPLQLGHRDRDREGIHHYLNAWAKASEWP